MSRQSKKRELAFRRPMRVTEAVRFSQTGFPYPRCPKCRLTIDREYMSFCDRCGQRLDWSVFSSAPVVTLCK